MQIHVMMVIKEKETTILIGIQGWGTWEGLLGEGMKRLEERMGGGNYVIISIKIKILRS